MTRLVATAAVAGMLLLSEPADAQRYYQHGFANQNGAQWYYRGHSHHPGWGWGYWGPSFLGGIALAPWAFQGYLAPPYAQPPVVLYGQPPPPQPYPYTEQPQPYPYPEQPGY